MSVLLFLFEFPHFFEGKINADECGKKGELTPALKKRKVRKNRSVSTKAQSYPQNANKPKKKGKKSAKAPSLW